MNETTAAVMLLDPERTGAYRLLYPFGNHCVDERIVHKKTVRILY
jgi:hypothetical protein